MGCASARGGWFRNIVVFLFFYNSLVRGLKGWASKGAGLGLERDFVFD